MSKTLNDFFCRLMDKQKQRKLTLDELSCERVTSANEVLLEDVIAPKVNGQPSSIVGLFVGELEANRKKELASYMITAPSVAGHRIALLLFALRCGEVFRQSISKDTIQKAHEVVNAVKRLQELDRQGRLQSEEAMPFARILARAEEEGLYYENARDIVNLDTKIQERKSKGLRQVYDLDIIEEDVKGVHQVFEVFPAIELKYFCINEKAKKNIWPGLNMPCTMGAVLFWQFVMGKVCDITDMIGAKYLYLFAADESGDKHSLVGYYKDQLHFNCDEKLACNKPYFDARCPFLFQSIDTLVQQRAEFLKLFKSASDEVV